MSKKQEKREKPLNYRQRSALSFVDQDDPAFIKKMKAQLGYREPAKVEDKFNHDEPSSSDAYDDDDILRMKDEDKPQVVVLENTDVSKEELEEEIAKLREEEDRKLIEAGKITFKKPIKRKADGDEKADEEKKHKESPTPQKKTETRLLSFDVDEDE